MIYIVLLNWNGWQDTIGCINSVYENIIYLMFGAKTGFH